ncbi:MAG: hypothetical protein AB8B71_12275 [Paracoccaceae bacterium]
MPNTAIQHPDQSTVFDARTRLKMVTDAVHQSLHVHPVSIAILNNGCPKALQGFLSAQLSLLQRLEQTAPRAYRAEFDMLKTALCDDLGAEHHARHIAVKGRAARAGTTYVVLGSLMGRKTLLAAMRRLPDRPFAQSYLTRPMPVDWWRWLLVELDELAGDDVGWRAVEAAALTAFEHIEQAMDGCLKELCKDKGLQQAGLA